MPVLSFASRAKRTKEPSRVPLVGLVPLLALMLAGGVAGAAEPASEGDVDLGAALYENHCGECHTADVHRRADSRVDSMDALRGYVAGWSAHANLGWGREEIDAVTRHLATRFYGFAW